MALTKVDPATAYIAALVHDGPVNRYFVDIKIENHGTRRVEVDQETHDAIMSAWQYERGVQAA